MTDANELSAPIEVGEQPNGSVEYKERLTRETHLVDGKRESLSAQMRHRVLSGDGEATYVAGITDDGAVSGIPPDAFAETVDVLGELTADVGAHIEQVQSWSVDGGLVGTVSITQSAPEPFDDNHIAVGTAGHVDHGKSTLVGSLVTGESDDGEGSIRQYLDVKPHEVERGLSADLSHAVYGFENGEPVHLDNPDRDSDRARVVEESDRVVSFVDGVGHEPWLRTTIRGLLGQQVDYGLLTVAADDGPMQTTREHLGILLAMEIPTIVAITKADLVDAERLDTVRQDVGRLLREVGKTPLDVDRVGVESAIEEIAPDIVPVVTTSAVSGRGLEACHELFAELPARRGDPVSGPMRMYVDRCYDVQGVGAVASGAITSGTVEVGDELLLGPFDDGSFREVTARSIEMHYNRVESATAGQIVGIALQGVTADDVSRGMALVDPASNPMPVREFEAELRVLNSPTRITSGYEPVVHLETISESIVVEPEGGQLLPGDTGTATVRFKFRPYYVEPGQQFVWREASSKGTGKVISVDP